jgi:hypothetical protein
VVPSLDVLFPCLGRFFFLVYPPFLLFGLSTFSWGYNFLSFICCFSLSDLSLYIVFPSIRLNLLDFYATFPIPPSLLFNRSFPPFPSDFNYSFFLSILRLFLYLPSFPNLQLYTLISVYLQIPPLFSYYFILSAQRHYGPSVIKRQSKSRKTANVKAE